MTEALRVHIRRLLLYKRHAEYLVGGEEFNVGPDFCTRDPFSLVVKHFVCDFLSMWRRAA